MERGSGSFLIAALLACLACLPMTVAAAEKTSSETQKCLECHNSTPGIVSQWKDSAHYAAGVGCYECHQANKGEPDAMNHYGFTVAVIVSPKDCGRCHPKEVEQDPQPPCPGRRYPQFPGRPAGPDRGRRAGGGGRLPPVPRLHRQGQRRRHPRSRPPGPTPASAGSTPTAPRAPAPPVIPGIASASSRRASPRPAANAISAPTIRRRRSTKSRSTASSTSAFKDK